MLERWQDVAAELLAACAPGGLDVVHPFQLGWVNPALPPDDRLDDFGRPAGLGLLIGSTRALWPRFVAALRAAPERIEHAHPLDTYVEEVVGGAIGRLRASGRLGARHAVRFAHVTAPRALPVQRLAALSGLAQLAPCRLCVHPTFGPWLALRAAVVVDVDGPPGPAPGPLTACTACAEACLPAFERAWAATLAAGGDAAAARAEWPRWVAVRDACPLGRSHRYDERALAYHGTGDRELLRALLDAA